MSAKIINFAEAASAARAKRRRNDPFEAWVGFWMSFWFWGV